MQQLYRGAAMQIKQIETKADHEAALARIDQLFDAEPDTPEGDELEVLATLVDAFEEEYYPIESPGPIEAIRLFD
ncbi:hypothetical protein L3Q72_05400 [Vibrio sp. JC009]|uniref:helix-turn-helix domain-containing protein n=1 Tax=Vibrio sp. JC009 TaxID=2912314 RepID=UPI0023B0F1A1|nr:hypothetical protein [Vibrio sp. JC009]WED22829.1 hypothetical protein L3Q72_05400 [Vibrio sp. JC009]